MILILQVLFYKQSTNNSDLWKTLKIIIIIINIYIYPPTFNSNSKKKKIQKELSHIEGITLAKFAGICYCNKQATAKKSFFKGSIWGIKWI